MMRRMLIVDDEETIRWALRELFMQDGWEAHCAADGDEAARLGAERTYDYMITDLRMPKRDGVETIREARQRNPRMGVTVLTGYAALETAVEALRLQAWDYVTKPCRVHALKQRVDEFFRCGGLGRQRSDGPEGLQDEDLAAVLAGAGTTLLDASPLHPAERSREALGRLRGVFSDLGLDEARSARLLQSCVEAVALLSGSDGESRGRAALYRGHVVVRLSGRPGAGEVSADVLRGLTERFGVQGRLVRDEQFLSVVMSEAI
jgi:CheY-like chemotaxis protein